MLLGWLIGPLKQGCKPPRTSRATFGYGNFIFKAVDYWVWKMEELRSLQEALLAPFEANTNISDIGRQHRARKFIAILVYIDEIRANR